MTVTTKPGRAEPALQAVLLRGTPPAPCDSVPSARREPFDGRDLGAVGLHREHQARAHRLAVDEHRARAAHAVLAPEVRAGERAVLPEEVGERLAGLDAPRRARAVDRHDRVTRVLASSDRACLLECAARAPGRTRCAPTCCRYADGRVHVVGRVEVGGRRAAPISSSSAAARRVRPSERGLRRRRRGAACAPMPSSPSAAALHGAVVAELDRGRDAGEREVAAAARDLVEREPAPALPDGERAPATSSSSSRDGTSSTCRRRTPSRGPGARRRPTRPRARRRARARPPAARTRGRRARSSRRSCRGCGSGSGR